MSRIDPLSQVMGYIQRGAAANERLRKRVCA
jgi:hypothetical protein